MTPATPPCAPAAEEANTQSREEDPDRVGFAHHASSDREATGGQSPPYVLRQGTAVRHPEVPRTISRGFAKAQEILRRPRNDIAASRNSSAPRATFEPSRLRARPGTRGFTLVEVLATIVLMTIVLPVAMHGVSLCLASAQSARQRTEAAGLAESKLNELLATGDWQYGLLSGDFGDAWPQYTWSGATGAWEDASLQELSVRVYWTSRGQEREVVLTTLVFESQATAEDTGL